MEYILNGQAHGSLAATLLGNGFDVAGLRPWIGKDGRSYIARNQGGKLIATPTMVANATLRREEWKIIDDAILAAGKERLRLVADLRSAGLTFNIPNGMGKTVLETSTVSDITAATISMDPARKSEGDRPEYDLVNLPLPVIHKDFYFNAREIAVSRNSGTGVDVTMAQLAARKVAEEAEKLALGMASSFTYGGGSIYGLINFPQRMTKILISPLESDYAPSQTITDILSMRQQMIDAFHFGPYMLYVSPGWDLYFDEDYSATKGDHTLRMRIKQINNITDVRTADYLTGHQMVLVQMTSDVIREVIGMDMTTIQWETDGGMRLHFKVMAIMVPQMRADHNGNTGVVHGVAL